MNTGGKNSVFLHGIVCLIVTNFSITKTVEHECNCCAVLILLMVYCTFLAIFHMCNVCEAACCKRDAAAFSLLSWLAVCSPFTPDSSWMTCSGSWGLLRSLRTGPGSQSLSHHPSQEQSSWGALGAAPALGTPLGMGWAGLWGAADQSWCGITGAWTDGPGGLKWIPGHSDGSPGKVGRDSKN